MANSPARPQAPTSRSALNPFFAGEVEPCINGQVGAIGAYFGQDARGIVDRLLAEQLPDGGWNCEAANGATRSSFNTTICVLEALLEYERAAGGGREVTGARLRGQEYLLERRLFRRRSTGEVIERDRKGGAAWTLFAFPTWWHYDVLRGLEYLRRAGAEPDERVAEAIDLVASKRDDDGRWLLDTQYPGTMPVQTDEGRGPAEPMEHPPRLTSAGLVFNSRLTPMPLAGNWRRPRLARSVTPPVLRWPDNRLRRAARGDAAEPEHQAEIDRREEGTWNPSSTQPASAAEVSGTPWPPAGRVSGTTCGSCPAL
jgi:hypothetical protein